jgi:hypothetical protein
VVDLTYKLIFTASAELMVFVTAKAKKGKRFSGPNKIYTETPLRANAIPPSESIVRSASVMNGIP